MAGTRVLVKRRQRRSGWSRGTGTAPVAGSKLEEAAMSRGTRRRLEAGPGKETDRHVHRQTSRMPSSQGSSHDAPRLRRLPSARVGLFPP